MDTNTRGLKIKYDYLQPIIKNREAKNYCILYRLFAVFNNPLKEYNKLIKQRLFLRSPVSNVGRETQCDENKEACYEKSKSTK